jgi:hypothetical protein
LFDAEGDPTFYRIVGATNGTARIASDGTSVSFTPATGYSGPASFSIVADDGYATSQVATVTVNVSNAPLVKLDFVARAPRLSPRASQLLQLVGDFADEQNVSLPASYIQFQSTNPTGASISAGGVLTGIMDGSTGVITASTAHGPGGAVMQAASAFSIGLPTDQTQQFLYALGLDVFPGAVSLGTGSATAMPVPLPPGQRQILVDLADTIDLTNGSTGTRYFVSNPDIVTVSADGLITAGQAGDAIVTVINGPAESLIPVKVQAPNVGPTLIGTEGGIVQDTNVYQVAIAPEALEESTLVSIAPVTQASLPLAMPGPFEYVASFDLQIGDGRLDIPAQLAIPISGSTLAPGSELVFFRYSTVLDETGATLQVWMQEETGIFGADGIARTTSPPFPGVLKSGTWTVAAAPQGSLARVDGKLNTFFPDEGSSFTVVAPMAGAPIAQEIHSPFFLYLLAGAAQPLVFYELSQFGRVTTTTDTVTPQAGTDTTFTITVINSFVDDETDPSGVPVMETTQVVINNGEAQLILTGSRFTYDVADPAAPNDGASITDLVINFDVPIREDQWTPEQLAQFAQEGVEIPTTYRVTATPDPLASSATTVYVNVPKGVILGLADVSVTRKTPVFDEASRTWKIEDRTSESTTIETDVHLLFAANNFDKTVAAIDITKDPITGQRANQVITRINVGDPARPGPTHNVALTPDLSRGYVTTGSGIAVIDVQTLQAVDLNPATPGIDHIIELPGSLPYWAVADKEGKYLYVSDTRVGTIYVIDIDPTSHTFHKLVKQISIDVAPEGLRGMDVTADGRRLYVAAPVRGGATFNKAYPDGKIVVIDIDTTPGNKTLWTKIADKTVSQEPYFVKASETDPRLVTFTNRHSDPNGFGVIRSTNDAHSNLNVTYAAMALGSRLDNFDVNDASAIALLPAGTLPNQTKDYAFVTGWNRIQQDVISRDPYMIERLTVDEIASGGFVLGAPVGGNIGVIEDPFGRPKLIAATAGQFLSMPDGIALSPDGKTLYASFRADNAVRVYDVQKIFAQITNPQNLVPNQFTRRDGQFIRLEISPLAGPPGVGVNTPIDPTIELGAIGTGRFPQGLAIAETLDVTIGFGRTGDPQGSVVINVTAEKGDTTPVFRWNVKFENPEQAEGATSRIYLSVFDQGQGLFPDDRPSVSKLGETTPDEDPNLHRIVNGAFADQTVNGTEGIFEFDLATMEPARRLTLGQTYYVGVEIRDGNGNVIERARKGFKLEQPDVPAGISTFSSVTVFTHGFEPPFLVTEVPKVFFELGKHIADAGGGGIVAKYEKRTGDWITTSGAILDLAAASTAIGKPLVLISDWITESRISDSGFAEAAADGLFASLLRLNNSLNGKIFGTRTDGVLGPFGPQAPIHLIGHSRGTSVNSEIIQRLGTSLPDVRVQMTTLDPHDFNQPSLNIPVEIIVGAFGGLATGGAAGFAAGGPLTAPLTAGAGAITGALLGALTKVGEHVLYDLAKALSPEFAALIDRLEPDLKTISYGEFQDPNVYRWENVSFADNYYQELGNSIFTLTPNGRAIDGFDINIPLSGLSGRLY